MKYLTRFRFRSLLSSEITIRRLCSGSSQQELVIRGLNTNFHRYSTRTTRVRDFLLSSFEREEFIVTCKFNLITICIWVSFSIQSHFIISKKVENIESISLWISYLPDFIINAKVSCFVLFSIRLIDYGEFWYNFVYFYFNHLKYAKKYNKGRFLLRILYLEVVK